MRIRAKANGSEIDLDDAAAKILIDAGIYEAVDEQTPREIPQAKKRRPSP